MASQINKITGKTLCDGKEANNIITGLWSIIVGMQILNIFVSLFLVGSCMFWFNNGW